MSFNSFSFIDLEKFTDYYVAIAARTQVGFGPYSRIMYVRTFESSKLIVKPVTVIH